MQVWLLLEGPAVEQVLDQTVLDCCLLADVARRSHSFDLLVNYRLLEFWVC